MGHMLTPLTPNLLAAVCLFFEFSHSLTYFFNYTLPFVLSEYIIQIEMHLEDIKITNAHHCSHNFNLAWCCFGFWLCFILYILSVPSQMAVCPPLRIATLSSTGLFCPLLMDAGFIYPVSKGEVLTVQVPLGMMKYSWNNHKVTSSQSRLVAGPRHLAESKSLFCSGS